MIITVFLFSASICESGDFIAYSLKIAEQRMKKEGKSSSQVMKLGDITAIAGMVYDEKNRDLLIVGQSNKGQPEITLDDLVVALRTMLPQPDPPLVSIDRTPDTKKTGKQAVVFKGKIENTQFGRDLLEADIKLKKIALDLLPSDLWGIESYFARIRNRSLQEESEDVIGSRFWFRIKEIPAFAAPEGAGVFAIRELKIQVETEVLYATIDGKPVKNLTNFHDKDGDEFAGQLTNKFMELSVIYPEIGRVKTLLDLVSLADGMKNFPSDVDIDYWLNDYKVAGFNTFKEYDLLKQQVEEKDNSGRVKHIELNGGIELQVMTIRLQAGDVTALKESVLQSRPNKNSLSWKIPIDDWKIPDALPVSEKGKPADKKSVQTGLRKNDEGFFVEAISRYLGNSDFDYSKPLPPPHIEIPKFEIYEKLQPQTQSPNGGVRVDGVDINSKPIKAGKGGSEVKEKVLDSRPSGDSPSWSVEMPEGIK